MNYGYMIFHLRAHKKLTQAQVAACAKRGWSQPQISQLEAREEAPGTDAAIKKVEGVVAWGEPRPGEAEPFYCLSTLGELRLPIFLFDDQRQFGIYGSRDAALFAVRILRFAGVRAQAAPLWVEYAVRVASGLGNGDPFVVDEPDNAVGLTRAICEHALSVLVRIQSDHEQAEMASAVGDDAGTTDELVQILLAAAHR
jgi:transcriptional regulator with XRE-family HTH domain